MNASLPSQTTSRVSRAQVKYEEQETRAACSKAARIFIVLWRSRSRHTDSLGRFVEEQDVDTTRCAWSGAGQHARLAGATER